MVVKRTDHGVLYGKTGSDADDSGTFRLGWFVGCVESKVNTYVFACTVKGENTMGKHARQIVESVLTEEGLL